MIGGVIRDHRAFVRCDERGVAVPPASIVRSVFQDYGEILDIYTPPSKPDVCFVAFSSDQELQAALATARVPIGNVWCTVQAAARRGSVAPAAVGVQHVPEAERSRVYVTNLDPDRADEEVLKCYFSYFGAVLDVYIPVDRATGQKKPFAFITMGSPEELQYILSTPTHQLADGITVGVSFAAPREDGMRAGGSAAAGSAPPTRGLFRATQTMSLPSQPVQSEHGNAAGSGMGRFAASPNGRGGDNHQAHFHGNWFSMYETGSPQAGGGASPQSASGPPSYPSGSDNVRLFVFGMPEGLNADMLKGHFWRHGELRDVYVPAATPDIAYITFSTPLELEDALHNSGLRIAGYWVRGIKPAEDRAKGPSKNSGGGAQRQPAFGKAKGKGSHRFQASPISYPLHG